jgi:hypothetical protein
MDLPKDLNERHDLLVALWKAAKEPLRLLVLAIIPVGLTWLAELDYQWAAVGILLLRLADKVLHEVGKTTDNETLTRGLTRF